MIKENIDTIPTLEEWRELFDAANCFRQEAPWEWMSSDTDIFGVRNPADGEIGYCSVLGNAGEMFGLAVYSGTEGLNVLLDALNKPEPGSDDDIFFTNKGMVASFGDKSELEKADKEVIRNLGLEFKGRNAFPLFRSYQPGYLPWYLNKEEAVFLALCLRQANEVALRYQKEPSLFNNCVGENYLVRIQDKISADKEWKDAWLPPLPLKKILLMDRKLDKERLGGLMKTARRQNMLWEVDYFYSPAYVAEKGRRPYYPMTTLFVDSISFFILNAGVSAADKYRLELDELFLQTIAKAEIIPEEILVSKKEAAFLLGPTAEYLGIKISLVKKLKAADDVRKEMFKHFRKME